MITIASKNRKSQPTQVNVTFTVPANVSLSAVAEHVEDALAEQGATLTSLGLYPSQGQ